MQIIPLSELISQFEEYDKLHWFSTNCLKKLNQYLFSQNSAIAAPKLVNAIVNTEQKDIDPTKLARQLVSKNVSIQYLISEMQKQNQSFDKIFDNNKLITFLTAFGEEYINEKRIREDQRKIAEQLFMSLPINITLKGDDKSVSKDKDDYFNKYINEPQSSNLIIKTYINEPQSSNLIIKTLLDKLDVKEISRLECDNNIKAKILAYEKLQSYQFFYSQFAKLHNAKDNDCVENNNIEYANINKLTNTSQDKQLNEIKKWFESNTNTTDQQEPEEPEKPTQWFASLRGYKSWQQRLLNALIDCKLIGSGYEKSICEHVGKAGLNNKDQAIQDAISKAYKEIVKNAKIGKSFIVDPMKDEEVESNISERIKNLKNINSNPRLQRIFKELVLKGLNCKTKDAAAIIMGKDSVKNMIDVISADIDNDLLTEITPLMSGTIEDIESKYNLKPGYLTKISRGYNQITGYPEWAFFKVVDFMRMLIEYMVEYTKRGLYKPYEWIRGSEREDQQILCKDDIAKILHDLKQHLQNKKSSANIQKSINIPQEEQLKNAIIGYLKDPTTGTNALKKALGENRDNMPSNIQKLINSIELNAEDISSDNQSELYQLYSELDKQSIGSHTNMLERQSQSIAILKAF